MATPPDATFPVPPPVPRLPIADKDGFPTPSFQEWCQLMWAAIQGGGGSIDKTIELESLFVLASSRLVLSQGGTVTRLLTGTGLAGGPITGTGTIYLGNTAVTPGSYGDSTHVVAITIDAQGRITAAANVAIASSFSKAQIQVTDPNGSALTTGNGQAYFRINALLNGMNLVAVAAALITPSSSGVPTVQIANVTDAVDMLSTKLTIDAGETDSSTAAVPAVIDTATDDVATADMLRIDVDVAGTGAKGLIVEMVFS